MFMNKKFLAILMGIIMIFSLAACSGAKNEVKNNKEKNAQVENKNTKEEKNDSAESESKVTKYPLSIVDSKDREVTIDEEPSKVVSIAPSITEIIFALEKQSVLIGRTDYCDYPAEVKDIESIGSLMEPNIEKITELKPDVVIASSHFKKEVMEKLESLDIKVLVLNEAQNFEGTYKTIKKVGEVLNAQDKANEIVTGMQNKIDSIKIAVKDAENPSVYYVVGFGEYGDYTATGDTFQNQLIEMAGATNAAADSTGWKYSLEKLVEKDPNILICSKYKNAKKGIEAANGYKDLTAVKEGKLFEIDNNMLDRQGPRLADGLEELAKIIHPELFK